MIESGPALYGCSNIREYLKRRAIESIARFLEENGCVKWERTGDVEKCAIIFRATLWVVRPEELEPSYKEWVEPHGD